MIDDYDNNDKDDDDDANNNDNYYYSIKQNLNQNLKTILANFYMHMCITYKQIDKQMKKKLRKEKIIIN